MTLATLAYEGKTIIAQELTPEAFAKFGNVISSKEMINKPVPAPGTAFGNIFSHRDAVIPVDNYDQSTTNKNSHCSFTLQRFVPPATIDREKGVYNVVVIERHPMTSQSFFPMGVDGSKPAYLVIVVENDSNGMPDLSTVKAFIARGGQSVTYGAAVWHGGTCSLQDHLDMTMIMYSNGVAADELELVSIENGMKVEWTA
ncbi:ureidoglycolate hydrolase [Lipomyces oligophaga]|uniref:ureidoglycolate hydrolase n=1 Tax=Lipomyces oligophaga TaxID=45792 RepID=UPI0034CD0DE4